MKPLSGNFAKNALAHGVSGLNIDGCRVQFTSAADKEESTTKNQHGDFGNGPLTNEVYGKYSKDRENYDPSKGRFPANVIHDGSGVVTGGFPQSNVQKTRTNPDAASISIREGIFGVAKRQKNGPEYLGDSGSASRFFKQAQER